MRIQLNEDVSREQNTFTYDNGQYTAGGAALCRYFVNGLCNRGSQCLFSHSLQAKRPVCKFFFSLQVSVPLFTAFTLNWNPLLLH